MLSTSDVLLVGADGYIGSNCPFNCDKSDVKSGTDFLEFELSEKYGSIIFLAAAKADVEQTVQDYLYNEALYDRLDEWLKEYPETQVIFASSAAVYGETTRPSKESDYLVPLGLYGRSKLAGEYRVREYMHHTVFRFGNVYGKLDGLEGHGVTETFINGGQDIYGDGSQVRDFIHMTYIWSAIMAAIEYPVIWRGVTNIGTGEGTTINDWFKKFGHGEPQYLPAREVDVWSSILDNTKMVQRLERCV